LINSIANQKIKNELAALGNQIIPFYLMQGSGNKTHNWDLNKHTKAPLLRNEIRNLGGVILKVR